jgi:orotidine-5'-phosphate decarboxylase
MSLILALDVPDRAAALPVLERLRGSVQWIKIGMQLFYKEGRPFVEEVAGMGFDVFLDLKLHDIPNTVASAVRSVADLPVKMLTVHASGGGEMLRAAADAAREKRPDLLVLAVTVLTSSNQATLTETGVDASPEQQVLRLAGVASAAGVGGLVCSPLEITALRAAYGNNLKLVVPGVRPEGAPADDQKRTLTPREAMAAGADYLVIGRPILRAADPGAAARAIAEEGKKGR